MKKIFLLTLMLITLASFAQTDSNILRLINPPALNPPKGYSHMAVINLGTCKMLIMSGQVGIDGKGHLAGNDVAKQTEQTFLNIVALVESEGGSISNVVKLSYFMLDVEQIQTVRAVRDKYINIQTPPASTLVQVSKLFRPDILIEIEATAIIPNKKN